jgi:hypothetical protein
MEVIRKERGWAGPFIGAARCEFHRNTLLQYGDQRVIVSTVGKMKIYHPFKSTHAYQQIGLDRYYETMVFMAHQLCEDDIYWHVDVQKEVSFESKWSVNHVKEVSDYEADEMHEQVVKEISQKMLAGTIKVLE